MGHITPHLDDEGNRHLEGHLSRIAREMRCNRCGGYMGVRSSEKTRQTFYGCRGYPACKGIQSAASDISDFVYRWIGEQPDGGPYGDISECEFFGGHKG